MAHLLIHTKDSQESPGGPANESFVDLFGWRAPLEQLRTRYSALWPGRADVASGYRVCIEDLQGHQLLDLHPTDSPLDVALAPGTYHVNAHIGGLQRSFTVTLQQDMRFELFLHRAAACGPH